MKIEFKGSKVIRLVLEDKESAEGSINFSYDVRYTKESKTAFMIVFNAEIVSSESIIKIEFAGFFECSEPITEDFQNSIFPTVSAPAITYPFLRSFVSTLTVNAGLEAIIMPTINFMKVKEENEAEAD